MSYPGIAEYNAALLEPRKSFRDPDLSAGTAAVTGMGVPHAISGRFALTYRIRSPGGRQWAVRCFTEDSPGRAERYSKISAFLASTAGTPLSNRFLETHWLEDGILVNGQSYPVVKMEWAEGRILGAYLEDCHKDREALARLRADLSSLADQLENAGAAHGDIQTGNLVQGAGGIRLIDYDGMFIPGMAEGGGAELGHIHFQHPGRTAADFSPRMDRFSFLLLELSLRALEAKPDLFREFSNGENLIFSGADLQDPPSSRVFKALYGIEEVRDLAALFSAICGNPVSRVPPLREFLERKPVTAVAIPHREARTGYQGDYPVFSALDFHVILNNCGRKAEVVGRVTEVKDGTTKYGKPYVFVNFGFWKGDIFKLSIWSEGLDEFRTEPDHSWVGKWVSAVGLLDEPYTSGKFGYTHCSITINDPSQVRFISEREAAFRMGRGGKSERETGWAGHAGPGNQDVLRGYFGEDGDTEATEERQAGNARSVRSPRPAAYAAPSRSAGGAPSNRELLGRLETGGRAGRNMPTDRPTPTPPTQSTYRKPVKEPGYYRKRVVWAVVILMVVAFLLYYLTGHLKSMT